MRKRRQQGRRLDRQQRESRDQSHKKEGEKEEKKQDEDDDHQHSIRCDDRENQSQTSSRREVFASSTSLQTDSNISERLAEDNQAFEDCCLTSTHMQSIAIQKE